MVVEEGVLVVVGVVVLAGLGDWGDAGSCCVRG